MKNLLSILAVIISFQLNAQLYFGTAKVLIEHPGSPNFNADNYVVPIDVNSDGLMDFIGSTTSDQFVLEGTAAGYDYISIDQGLTQPTLEVIDLDHDGDTDAVMQGYLNFNNNGQFEYHTFPSNYNESIVSVADFDGDGDYDFITQKEEAFKNDVLRIYLNDQFVNFDANIFEDEEKRYSKFLEGDIDNDGDIDLLGIFIYGGKPALRIWDNDGNGIFQTKNDITFSIEPSGGIGELADLDLDGDLDLVLCNGYDKIYLLFNDNGSFGNIIELSDVGKPLVLKLIDLNNDGFKDIVYLDQEVNNLKLRIIENTHDENYYSRYIVGTFPGNSVIFTIQSNYMNNLIGSFDYNNDGKQDLIVNSLYDGKIYGLENKSVISATNDESHNNEVVISPNPVQNLINIDSQHNFKSYEIYGLTGKVIKRGTIDNNQISVSELISGEYFLRLSENGSTFSIKIVKI
ncbi:MAG: T9SS type A sorting domain-containing protein [Saprospiraceae bacterium]|nr:T9SS type A sorting domain-containing protein [Saprospiraceae bacterium]MCB9327923.1 T9SS type A sorting domain-containing protein [Lewinellaceae bacterium]